MEAVAAERKGRAVVAASTPPVHPPASWFERAEADGPTPLTITADGEVYGHAALWDTCHTGMRGRCVTAPRSRSGYQYFNSGLVETDAGDTIPAGRITLDTGHAQLTASPQQAAAHYDHTGAVVADVAAMDGKYGIWVRGALRPGISDEKQRALRAATLSGDWRNIRGSLELLGLLCVNVPGFPVPRVQEAVTASALEEDELIPLALVGAGALVADGAGCHGSEMDEKKYRRKAKAMLARAEGGLEAMYAAADPEGAKVRKVMREFKAGKLKSGSGEKVKDRKQALAIALNSSGFDESKHPRHPAGETEGGQFAPKGTSKIAPRPDEADAGPENRRTLGGKLVKGPGGKLMSRTEATERLDKQRAAEKAAAGRKKDWVDEKGTSKLKGAARPEHPWSGESGTNAARFVTADKLHMTGDRVVLLQGSHIGEAGTITQNYGSESSDMPYASTVKLDSGETVEYEPHGSMAQEGSKTAENVRRRYAAAARGKSGRNSPEALRLAYGDKAAGAARFAGY